jgi:hypothetical protein
MLMVLTHTEIGTPAKINRHFLESVVRLVTKKKYKAHGRVDVAVAVVSLND